MIAKLLKIAQARVDVGLPFRIDYCNDKSGATIIPTIRVGGSAVEEIPKRFIQRIIRVRSCEYKGIRLAR